MRESCAVQNWEVFKDFAQSTEEFDDGVTKDFGSSVLDRTTR
jgi:hypothetical protein